VIRTVAKELAAGLFDSFGALRIGMETWPQEACVHYTVWCVWAVAVWQKLAVLLLPRRTRALGGSGTRAERLRYPVAVPTYSVLSARSPYVAAMACARCGREPLLAPSLPQEHHKCEEGKP